MAFILKKNLINWCSVLWVLPVHSKHLCVGAIGRGQWHGLQFLAVSFI